MLIRLLAIAAVALAAPAIAVADIGPHSDFYDQHPAGDTHKNDVTVLLDRRTHVAIVSVRNACLGTEIDGGERFPRQVDITVRVRHGSMVFAGRAPVILKTRRPKVFATLEATVQPKHVIGEAAFPDTRCAEISFTAKHIEHTK